ncbi:MAG TPA: IS1595 family transposase [Terracidiphilus sp.]|jgi:transposase-like protein
MEEPKTLQQAILYFSDEDRCIAYLAAGRWPDGVVVCPTCGRQGASYVARRRVWQCKTRHPKAQFSIKIGTIFEDSPIPLCKWLAAMWMIANCKNGISSYEIHRALKVTQKTAWFMLHRVRLSLKDEIEATLCGTVEVDETFIGGKVKNMHKHKRPKGPGASGKPVGATGKAIVVGMLERKGRVRAQVVFERTQSILHGIVEKHVEPGSTLMTDEWGGYKGTDFQHEVINHADSYVRGLVHTNGIENFWSLLKRGINGTYVSVEPFHLFRYIDEQAFRYNNRATKDNPLNDGDRFALAVSQILGRRLTYKELTGKTAEARQV